MNRKELKERIRQAAIEEMPDVLDRINLNHIEIEQKEKRLFTWRKQFKWAVSAFVMVLTGFFTFQLFFQQPSSNPFETDVELLAFQTVSAGSLIEYAETNVENLSLVPLSDNDASDIDPYLTDMSPMIELAELLINQREQIQYEEMPSDNQNFQYKIRYSAINLLDETIEFNIYYNQLPNSIQGIVVQGDKTYEFNQDEQRLRLYYSQEDYIDVAHQEAQSMYQFSYRFMRQNTELFSTDIELVLENAQYQANFTYNNRLGKVISLQMRRNNDQTLDVDYEVDDQEIRLRGRFNVSVQNDTVTGHPIYRFLFDDESESQTSKPGNHMPGRPNGNPWS